MKEWIVGQQKQLSRLMMGLLIGMALLWLAGCTCADGVPRNMEADYGRSVTNDRLGMMLTPPDAVDPRPAVGLSPQAAANTQGRYDKSFKEKPPETPTIRSLFR